VKILPNRFVDELLSVLEEIWYEMAVIGADTWDWFWGCLAEAGHEVIATDNDASKIAALQAGKIPIYEPNLDKVWKVCTGWPIKVYGDAVRRSRESDVIFICVGTPPTDEREADCRR